jgi:hypothetical protein
MAAGPYAEWQYDRWARFAHAARHIGEVLLSPEKPTHIGLHQDDSFDLVAVNVGRVAIIRERGFGQGLVTRGRK